MRVEIRRGASIAVALLALAMHGAGSMAQSGAPVTDPATARRGWTRSSRAGIVRTARAAASVCAAVASWLRVVGERPTAFELHRLAPVTIPGRALAAYAGDYGVEEIDTTYSISANGERLILQIPGRSPIALQAIDRDGFAGSLVGVIRFTRRDGGTISGFTLHANGVRGLRFERQPRARR